MDVPKRSQRLWQRACCAQEEVWKARLAALKREEELAKGELARLEAEKVAHIR
jgi:hypothetical protein